MFLYEGVLDLQNFRYYTMCPFGNINIEPHLIASVHCDKILCKWMKVTGSPQHKAAGGKR